MIKKVLVIGIDGATFNIIDPLIKRGLLPHLSRLMHEGRQGYLESTLPPITGPAWRTFATGVNPGKHGVIDFVELERETRRVRIKDASKVNIPTFWDRLGAAGKIVGLIGVPMTFPAREVNGFLLSGLMTPPNSRDYCSPRSIHQELKEHGLTFYTSAGSSANANDPELYLQRVIEEMNARLDVGTYLFEKHQPDCGVFVIGCTDPIQHQFYKYLDGGQSDPAIEAMLHTFYTAVDDGVGRLLRHADDDTLVIVMSDHGFGRLHGFLHLNNWLLENGYLKLRRDPITQVRYLAHKLGYTPENMYALARNLGFDMRRRLNRGRMYSLAKLAFLSFANVDWEKTTAYALGHIGQVYINEQALSRPYDEMRTQLRDDLMQITMPGSQELVFEDVVYREDVYSGEFVDEAPDLLLRPNGFKYVAFGESEFASNQVFGRSLHSGHHQMEGILIMKGPGVAPASDRQLRSIASIAPTILYALGEKLPSYLDGSPLTDDFTEDYVSQNPPEYSGEILTHEPNAAGAYSPDEERQVRQRLRDLGYDA